VTVPAYLLDGERYPHGTRARYNSAKCRCADCRRANRDYENARQARHRQAAAELAVPSPAEPAPQVWTRPDGSKAVRLYRRACKGIGGQPCPYGAHLRKDSTGDVCNRCRGRVAPIGVVPADAVRAHLVELQRQGIGYRAIVDATDVPRQTIIKLARGVRKFVRAESAAKILAVDVTAAADHAIIDAAETHRLLRELIREGYTRTRLAAHLGSLSKTPALQFKASRVLAKTEQRVRKLHAALLAEAPDEVAPIDESPMARILSALRWFESATLGDLLDAMEIEHSQHDAYGQALHRAWKAGKVERHGEGKPYLYRLPEAA
jgi:hypothetical protein